MINDLFFIGVGAVLGWFFLPTPEWARVLVARIPYVGKYMK